MSAPASRPVHPCLVSLSDATRGVEFSTWAYITTGERKVLPNLVTASGTSLFVYSIDPDSGKLFVEHSFGRLAGDIVFLEALSSPDSEQSDVLLTAFAGNARLALLHVQDGKLQSESLVDLSTILMEHSGGLVTEEDIMVTSYSPSSSSGLTTVSCILGGGVAVAVFEVVYHRSIGGWEVSVEPYILPLQTLSISMPYNNTVDSSNTQQQPTIFGQSICTGFGDIIASIFLKNFLEPVLVLLHSDPQGKPWIGRLGRDCKEEDNTSGARPLYLTAMSLSVAHNRTALLWSKAVPADSLYLTNVGSSLVCVGANTLVFSDAMGTIGQVLATNGWSKATCPTELLPMVQANPIVKLSLQLDGSCMTALSGSAALIALRSGQLYVLQHSVESWVLLPLGKHLGAVGEVALLTSFSSEGTMVLGKNLVHDDSDTKKRLDFGIVFAGSRMGDSVLMGFTLETVTTPMVDALIKSESALLIKDEEAQADVKTDDTNDEYDRVLLLEEKALYAPVENEPSAIPHVVPTSETEEEIATNHHPKKPRLAEFSVLNHLTPLDTLVNPGPLGGPCVGPLAGAPSFLQDTASIPGDTTDIFGATASVFPCGMGSSGGLAVLSVPGRDDRVIDSEQDCLDVECMFSLSNIVVLGLSACAGNGVRLLRVDSKSETERLEIEEVDSEAFDPTKKSSGVFDNASEVLKSTLLGAGEASNGNILFVVRTSVNEVDTVVLVVFDAVLEVVAQHVLDSGERTIMRLTSMCQADEEVVFGICWYSGEATIIRCQQVDGSVQCTDIVIQEGQSRDAIEIDQIEDEEECRIRKFYTDSRVVALDVFEAPEGFFSSEPAEAWPSQSEAPKQARVSPTPIDVAIKDDEPEEGKLIDWSKMKVAELKTELIARDLPATGRKADLVAALVASDKEALEVKREQQTRDRSISAEQGHKVQPTDKTEIEPSVQTVFDEEEEMLYASTAESIQSSQSKTKARSYNGTDLFVAVCRQSGQIELYSSKNGSLDLVWAAQGCGLGQDVLSPNEVRQERVVRYPRQSMVSVREMRLFFCGATPTEDRMLLRRRLFLGIETTPGDFTLYSTNTNSLKGPVSFCKIPLFSVGRQSNDHTRHYSKLLRKKMVSDKKAKQDPFLFNNLYSFSGISGQDGLFWGGSRPQWIVCERGRPTFLFHRSRHALPVGGVDRPVRSFCTLNTTTGTRRPFLTLHERVGKIGSQRLTLFNNISKVFDSSGILLGSGFCLERIPLGVTVRQIQFIDDPTVSSGAHPLYAVLVSNEEHLDQSEWNSDGLTEEERREIERKKDEDKVRKQVEADLGGFDLQSEWVEEIERENCFEIDLSLGGAPPIRNSAYSLWIVDASNRWAVVDSYEFGDQEHGMTMQPMALTEFREEPGSTIPDDGTDSEQIPFIAVGTAIVDHNGEDVSSHGRVLLFRLTSSRSQVAELSLTLEKNIFHGPVASLSCLSVEGRNRLVIGAGADVNIEQWGTSGKLTQVGFFRATMQILDISLFKNFFLLSDAYDSLYFLVWRESDKSLTLLAKDYDPIPVYATGLMSRGPAMTFVCHDDRQNVQFFQYAPGEAAARGGNKLVCRADCHLGTQTTSFASHFCRSTLISHSATPSSTLSALKQQDTFFGRTDNDQRLGVHFGTTDGGIGSIVPVSEPVYWRLMALQSVMSNALEPNCSLNRNEWRLYQKTPRRGGCRSNDRKKSVLDGDLILQYADLSIVDQDDLAASIGSSSDLILDNLLDVQNSSTMM